MGALALVNEETACASKSETNDNEDPDPRAGARWLLPDFS